MLIDRVYMPAEIAVNSTVEKIQSSYLLKGYEPGQKCLIKAYNTIIDLHAQKTQRNHHKLPIRSWTSINSYLSTLIIISEDSTLFFPQELAKHYHIIPTTKRRLCRTPVPASDAATTAWLRTKTKYPAPSVVPNSGPQPHDVPTIIITLSSIQHSTIQD